MKEIQSINLKQRKNDFNELIKCIKEEKCLNIAKKYAEELKNQLLESLKKDLRKHKIGAAISGIIPLGDILIQHFIKKDAKEKVSQKFKDDLLDFEKKNKNEKNIKNKEQESIEGIKDKIDDKKSDIMKTIGRITTIGINIGLKTVSVAVGFVGCIIGVVTGGLVMNYDINAYLEFYGNRFVNKCLLNFSFNLVEKYFEENFENNEENDSFKNENKYIEKTICINNNNINIKSTLEKFITIYIIKNEELKYLPQIEIKFNKINNINKEFISEFKEEIKNIINNDNFSIIEIKKGSLTVILALQFLILIELGKYNNKEQNKFNIKQFSENFTIKIRKEVQKLCEILIKNVFISLGAVKPTYANPNIIDISDKNNQQKMEDKIKEVLKNNNNDGNVLEISNYITKENLEQFYNYLSNKANGQEKNLKKLIGKLDEFNKIFDEDIEQALKESIFQYKIEQIFLVEKNVNNFLEEKNNCTNIVQKILFHGTKIKSALSILSTQFYDATYHLIGKGVYFTDKLDYAWSYSRENIRYEINIPKVGDSFSVVATEVYYDNKKVEKVFDTSTENKEVKKFGVRCCYSNFQGSKLSRNEIVNNRGFIAKEYLITNKDQILPLYCVTMKRIEYLVIWRDYHFAENNPNNYSDNIFKIIKEFHNNIKRKITLDFDSIIYYIRTTEEALNLIEIKKFNKIIIITNANNDAREFINKVRNIIGENTIVGVSVYDIKKHISWIKDMENTIVLNGIEYHEKFFKSIMNNSIEELKNLREEIIKDFSISIPNFSFRELNENVLHFPNFKNEGQLGNLTNINNIKIENEINERSCQII